MFSWFSSRSSEYQPLSSDEEDPSHPDITPHSSSSLSSAASAADPVTLHITNRGVLPGEDQRSIWDRMKEAVGQVNTSIYMHIYKSHTLMEYTEGTMIHIEIENIIKKRERERESERESDSS